jgi:hypothetical protein
MVADGPHPPAHSAGLWLRRSRLRRPSFDRPLRNFHRAVGTIASDAQRILVTIDSKANVIATLPLLGDKLRRIGEALAPI